MVAAFLVSGSAMSAGCVGPGEEEGVVVSSREALTQTNGLAANGLAANGLAANGLAANGLAVNGLAANGLAANGLAANGLAANGLAVSTFAVTDALAAGLQDAASRQLFAYIVSCALPDNVALTFVHGDTVETFPGDVGLAPSWLTTGCDLSCQRWVSACLIARTNFRGEHVGLSIRGANDALKVEAHEQQTYTAREAAYYGNVFLSQPALFACLPRGATELDRVCGPSLETCAVKVTGTCEMLCDAGSGRNYSYRNCRSTDAASSPGAFAETITVFRQP